MVETMDNEKAIDYMKGIHDALPHAAMQLLARDVTRFLSEKDDAYKRLVVLATKHCPRDHHDFEEIIKLSSSAIERNWASA